MTEVYLTAKQAAEALDLSYFTIVKYAGEGMKGAFPHARLKHGSRRKGYRIPASDILTYARTQGEDVEQRAMRIIARVRREQISEDNLEEPVSLAL